MDSSNTTSIAENRPSQPARMIRPSDILTSSKSGSGSGSTSNSYYSSSYSGIGSSFGFFDEQLDTPLDEEAWKRICKTLSMTAADVEAKIKAEEAEKKLAAMSIDGDGDEAGDKKPSPHTKTP